MEVADASRDRVVACAEPELRGLVVTADRAQAARDGRACAQAHPDDHCGDSPVRASLALGSIAPHRPGFCASESCATHSLSLRCFAVGMPRSLGIVRALWQMGEARSDAQNRTRVRAPSPTIMPGEPVKCCRTRGCSRRSETTERSRPSMRPIRRRLASSIAVDVKLEDVMSTPARPCRPSRSSVPASLRTSSTPTLRACHCLHCTNRCSSPHRSRRSTFPSGFPSGSGKNGTGISAKRSQPSHSMRRSAASSTEPVAAPPLVAAIEHVCDRLAVVDDLGEIAVRGLDRGVPKPPGDHVHRDSLVSEGGGVERP